MPHTMGTIMANKTKAEKKHLDAVAQVGCIVCKMNGYDDTPAEIHHIRDGVGIGQRSSNYDCIPLCPIHHRTGGHGEIGFHQAPRSFESRYGTEQELLEMVNELLDNNPFST